MTESFFSLSTEDISEMIRMKILSARTEAFKAARSFARGEIKIDPKTPYADLLLAASLGAASCWETLFQSSSGSSSFLVSSPDKDAVSILVAYPGYASIEIIATDPNAKWRLDQILKAWAKFRIEKKREGGVWVDFTHEKNNDIKHETQFLRCPTWPELRANYAKGTRQRLDDLMALQSPWDFGRLMVWHGPPGTGKTYALRALMVAWRESFDFVVVTDPERLAADPAYYYSLASKPVNRQARGPDDDEEENDEKRRVLFILEDSADLIILESRSTHYDKVNKLLNITDGLIGQGREDIFLVTFNEGLQEIDKAFLRPGRCLAQVEFGLLDQEEGTEWLGKHGVDTRLAGESSLADLYAKAAQKASKTDLLGAADHVVGGFSPRSVS